VPGKGNPVSCFGKCNMNLWKLFPLREYAVEAASFLLFYRWENGTIFRLLCQKFSGF